MTANKSILNVAISLAVFSGFQTTAHAHGWSEFPAARQHICYSQGGLWSGSPPNEACAAAKRVSGTYPFVQQNEFSKNIADFRNIAAVKAAIPDGTLCYANDPQKQGMGVAHTEWTRTQLNTGTFQYVFNATASHNPSYWEFYLTKPNADLNKKLAWSDLELIHSNGNVLSNGGKYRMNVTIPSDRSGDAILFVRWQRDDSAGEGFYNCSDITINGDGEQTPVLTPDLVRGEAFISEEFESPEIGDIVQYDIFNQYGDITRSFDIDINSSNMGSWARLLASEINGWHEQYKDGAIFIGDWHSEMQHYMYFQDDISRNYFNSKSGNASGELSLIKSDNEQTQPLESELYELASSDNIVNAGEVVVYSPEEPSTITQTQGDHVTIENNDSSLIVIDTSAIQRNQTLSFSANSINSNAVETFSFEVLKNSEEVIDPSPEESIGESPTASFTIQGATHMVGLPLSVDASNSYDSDGNIEQYLWEMTDPNGEVIYPEVPNLDLVFFIPNVSGEHEIKLTVIDNENNSNVVTKTVVVN
ncbi:lytic polysaccharide monooxygenase [Vibrio paucivorans]